MEDAFRYPPAWLAETQVSYRQYVLEWNREEAERAVALGVEPESPQEWKAFLLESVYAELENSTYIAQEYTKNFPEID